MNKKEFQEALVNMVFKYATGKSQEEIIETPVILLRIALHLFVFLLRDKIVKDNMSAEDFLEFVKEPLLKDLDAIIKEAKSNTGVFEPVIVSKMHGNC